MARLTWDDVFARSKQEATRLRWQRSAKGIESRKRYHQSSKRVAARKRYLAKQPAPHPCNRCGGDVVLPTARLCQSCVTRFNCLRMGHGGRGPMKHPAHDPEDIRDSDRFLWDRHPKRLTVARALELARLAVWAEDAAPIPGQANLRLNLIERIRRPLWVAEGEQLRDSGR